MHSGRSLDHTIDSFCDQLGQFAKEVKEEVSTLQRNLEKGYSLTPQELRERLKRLEQQTKEIRKDADEIEAGTFGEISLAELTYKSWVVYQETNNGITALETHLKNYGYESDPVFLDYSPNLNSAVDKTQEQVSTHLLKSPLRRKTLENLHEKDSGLRSSISFETTSPLLSSKCNWLNLDYSAQQELNKHEDTYEKPRHSSCSLSDKPVFYSPGVLDLKKKYNPSITQDQLAGSLRGSVSTFKDDQSFEFCKEGEMEVDEIDGKPTLTPRESYSSNLSQVVNQQRRVSFAAPSVSFGSPFRSPHHKPECSIFHPMPTQFSELISRADYSALPQDFQQSMPYEELIKELENRRFPSSSWVAEAVNDQRLFQAMEKLGLVKKVDEDDGVSYIAGERFRMFLDSVN